MAKRFLLFDDVNNRYVRGDLNEDSITQNDPDEVLFNVSGDSTTDYSVSGVFSFDPSSTVEDIVVHRNVSRQYLSPTGALADGHYIKLDATTIRFLYNPRDGDKVSIRKEGTAGGLDLENIGVDPQPSASGGQKLGSSSRPWNSLFVKDLQTGSPVEIAVSGGSLVLL